jgi:hypothetical protein
VTADVAAPEARRRWTLLLALGTVLLIVAGVAAWADTEAKHYYTYQPGTAPLITTSPACRPDPAEGELVLPGGTPCARLVVPATREHAIRGRLLMVDVLVGPANAFEYILHEVGLLGLFEPGSALKPAATVLGPAPPSQLGCEDTEEMAGAQIAAPVAALTRLHYHVRAVQHGAQVFLVAPRRRAPACAATTSSPPSTAGPSAAPNS